jgi:hypothetical protein
MHADSRRIQICRPGIGITDGGWPAAVIMGRLAPAAGEDQQIPQLYDVGRTRRDDAYDE